MAEQKANVCRLGIADQRALAKAVSLFSSKTGEGDAGMAGAGFVVFTGKTARFSNGLVGLEIPFTAISGCALPLGAAAEVIFKGETEITVARTEDAIKVVSGGFSANLRFVNQEALPAWPVSGKRQGVSVSAEAWTRASSIAFAADTGARSEISGVFLHKTLAFATDGVRAARIRLPGDGVKDVIGVIPLKLIALVEGYSVQAPPNAIAFGENRAWVHFADGSVAWSLLPAADYPTGVLTAIAQRSKAVGQVLHVAWKEQAEALVKAVERVVVFSDGPGIAVKAAGSVLQIHGKGSRGEATERVNVDKSVDLDGISVNGLLFADACRRSQGLTASPEKDCLFFRCPGFELLLMCLVG